MKGNSKGACRVGGAAFGDGARLDLWAEGGGGKSTLFPSPPPPHYNSLAPYPGRALAGWERLANAHQTSRGGSIS